MLAFRGFELTNFPDVIFNSPSSFVQWSLPMSRRVCLASASSGVNSEQLRDQLDILHKEAERAAAKANNTRMRLIRLSEAADSLRRQAVLRVQTGKENDARELLHQKKKIMQAMEKSKNRIELLDELSAKLRQVISAKETQLIGNVSLDLEDRKQDDEITTNIRIVPPKDEYRNVSVDNNDSFSNTLPFHPDVSLGDQNNDGLLKENIRYNKVGAINGSYQDFLKNIDSQLSEIEDELTTFLSYAALIFGNKNKLKDSNVQLVAEILENVCHIRKRIATILQSGVETRL